MKRAVPMLEHLNGADHKAYQGGPMARVIIAAALFFALCFTSTAQQLLPDAPKPKASHFIFGGGVVLLAASKTADAWATRGLLDRGGWENNPVLGRHPSTGRLAGIDAAAFLAQSSLFYATEHNRRSWVRWSGRAYIALQAAGHFYLSSCNSNIDTHSSTRHNCRPILPF